jgi:AraC family transcriptional regulator
VESAIPFVEPRSRARVAALGGARIEVSSRGRGWDGVLAERGVNGVWETDGLAIAGHYVAVNLGGAPLSFEVHEGGRSRRVVMPPHSLWVNPDGRPFTHRVAQTAVFGAVVLDAAAVPAGLGPEYGLEDPPLAALVRALVDEAERGGREPLAAETLACAVAVRLAARAGDRRAGGAPRERLRPAELRRVAERAAAGLGERLRLADLAAAADLSPFHFARAFRATVGESPHAWVMARRLERAREALRAGEPPAAVATALGFADQAHLTRAFRRRFGCTPGSVARAARR